MYAPSGKESIVRNYLEGVLRKLKMDVTIDRYGNLLAKKTYGNACGQTVLLSAHMDTVSYIEADKTISFDGKQFKAYGEEGHQTILGADDRAGIAIILEVLENLINFNGTIKVAFTVNEEEGCQGSLKMDEYFYNDVALGIIVDRRGNRDIVVANGMAFCCDEVGDFMMDVSGLIADDYKCVEGGISDAKVFSERGLNCVNLSCGYYNEHTDNEYLVLKDMTDTVKLIIHALALVDAYADDFDFVPASNKWMDMPIGALWAEKDDDSGYVYACEIDGSIVLTQGTNEIVVSHDTWDSLVKQLKTPKKGR